ncbi:MAG: hypothetical protein KGR16_07890 [Verrucomicrobia bacterium]|nr:hypothetical protein [Verrucomicrobiota bacterium]
MIRAENAELMRRTGQAALMGAENAALMGAGDAALMGAENAALMGAENAALMRRTIEAEWVRRPREAERARVYADNLRLLSTAATIGTLITAITMTMEEITGRRMAVGAFSIATVVMLTRVVPCVARALFTREDGERAGAALTTIILGMAAVVVAEAAINAMAAALISRGFSQ